MLSLQGGVLVKNSYFFQRKNKKAFKIYVYINFKITSDRCLR